MTRYTNIGFGETTHIPDDLFFLNPANQYMVTGKRDYRYIRSKFGCAGLIVMMFLSVFIAFMIPPFVNEMRLLMMETNTTEGSVINLRISSGRNTSYYLTYTFSVNNREYTREESITRSEYNERNSGDWVTITYAKGDPTSSHLGLPGMRWMAISPFLFFAGFLIVMGGVLFLSDLPRRRRIVRMRRDGQLILGQIKSTNGKMVRRGSGKSRRTDYDVTLFYEFTNPDHILLNSKETFVRNDLKNRNLPNHGSVTVLYVNNDDFMVL